LLATETLNEPEIERLKAEIVAPPALPARGTGAVPASTELAAARSL
jgi:hypothetical protein